jgi:hypothetical protein
LSAKTITDLNNRKRSVRRKPGASPEHPGVEADLNRAEIRRILADTGVQAKLTVGDAEDRLEREADIVAERIAAGLPAQALSRSAPVAEARRIEASPEHDSAPSALTDVAERAIAATGSGRPLDAALRARLESAIEADLGAVRVHDDARAQAAGRALNARAFTQGRDIWLGPGESQTDIRLMAHEAAHVLQSGAIGAGSSSVPVWRQAAGPRPAPGAQLDTVLAELDAGTLGLNDAAKWKTLAANTKDVKAHAAGIQTYFKREVDAGRIGFENITEEQRKVFTLLDATQMEALRKAAIQKSHLFQVLTEMQLQTHSAAERARVTAERMSPAKSGDYYPNSLAAMFADYVILPEVLIAEVGPAATARNQPLAKRVRQLKDKYKADLGKVKEELVAGTWWMACGLGNLFALSASRGLAAPTEAGARQWLKDAVLDQPPDKALVQFRKGKFDISTNQVLTDLSASGRQPKYAAEKVPLTKAESPALFQAAMEKSSRGLEARLGIVQGKGEAGHMYIVYKDMDGVWRTMDMYMSIGDRPGGGLPYSKHYATEKAWHKLVVD